MFYLFHNIINLVGFIGVFFGLNNSVFAFKFKLGVANEFYIKSSKRFEFEG